jgi:hypothetical protein
LSLPLGSTREEIDPCGSVFFDGVAGRPGTNARAATGPRVRRGCAPAVPSVRPLIRGKRGRQRFDEGMAGKPAPNALAAALPGFVDAARARAWTDHPVAALPDAR